jgi:hypothetical protein
VKDSSIATIDTKGIKEVVGCKDNFYRTPFILDCETCFKQKKNGKIRLQMDFRNLN